jgi:hypothetical protein
MLEERFTEDELKQIIAILESPVNRKFQAMGGDMQRALIEKLVAETRPLIEPKLRALEQTMRAAAGRAPAPLRQPARTKARRRQAVMAASTEPTRRPAPTTPRCWRCATRIDAVDRELLALLNRRAGWRWRSARSRSRKARWSSAPSARRRSSTA